MGLDKQQKRGTFIHGVVSTQHIDSSGERIIIEGVDISSLTKDGTFNYEHDNKSPSSVVGKILEAKKILAASDCENDHHLYFWNKIKLPFIYCAGELFDAVGHKEAQEVAALLRYDQLEPINKESKKLINFSIEGSRVEKQGSNITKCIARRVALTGTPCNKVCEAEELKLDPKEEKHSDSGDFKFIQDIMGKSDEPSCQIMKGNIPFLYKNAKITMPAKEAVKEHKRLVTALESPSHKDDKEEAKKQRKELKEYKKVLNKKEKKVSPKDPVLGSKPQPKTTSKEYEEKSKAYLESKKVKKAKDVGVLAKPYVSDAQRRWAHTQAGKEALGGAKAVAHWDKESKGKDLPERKKKKLSKYDSNVRKTLTASCGLGASPAAKTQGEAVAKSEEQFGKKLGQTRSGQDVFANQLVGGYTNFTPEDHYDASLLHRQASLKTNDPKIKNWHQNKMRLHQSAFHTKRNQELTQKKRPAIPGNIIPPPQANIKNPNPMTQPVAPLAPQPTKIIPPSPAQLPQKPIIPPKMAKSEIKKVMKKLGDEAFNRFEKKEDLLKFLEERLPKLSDRERLAIAKAIAYTHEKKKELILKSLLKKENK